MNIIISILTLVGIALLLIGAAILLSIWMFLCFVIFHKAGKALNKLFLHSEQIWGSVYRGIGYMGMAAFLPTWPFLIWASLGRIFSIPKSIWFDDGLFWLAAIGNIIGIMCFFVLGIFNNSLPKKFIGKAR